MKLGLSSQAVTLLENVRASTPVAAFEEAAYQMLESLESDH